MDKNVTVIEERIFNIRERIGYTQEELAKKLGVSRSLVNNWENGYANISLKQLIKLAYIYQVPIDYLLGIIEEIDDYEYHYIDTMDLNSIGLKLKEIRKNNKMTQDKFAQKIRKAQDKFAGKIGKTQDKFALKMGKTQDKNSRQ